MMRSVRLVIAAASLAAIGVANAQDIKVQINGSQVYFANAQPQYINGRVLVPLRGVFEQMGASVNWNPSTRMVSAMKDGTDVELRIGDRTASVNGSNITLDVPAMIVNGSTLVPIRFLSESLGAQVGWMEADHLVTITTAATQTQAVTTQPEHLRRVILQADEVIPVTLDTKLSTDDSKVGDKFTATVDTKDLDNYADIPRGSQIEGHIIAVHGKENNRPAIIDLAFDRIRFPNGKKAKIDGVLTSTDDKYVVRGDNGRIVARKDENNNKTDQRMVYAGYGAGAGLLVGVLGNKPLEGTILGGAIGFILGQVQHDKQMSKGVTLQPGTQMGIRLNRDLTTGW